MIGRHYSDSLYRLTSEAKRRVLLALEQGANRAAARIIVPSRMIEEILVRRQGVAAARVDRIPYGFVEEKYSVPEPAAVAAIRREFELDGKLVAGNFARLHEEKGQRFLVETVAGLRQRLPDLRVLIVGEGPERAALEQQIRRLGVEKEVRLVGWRRDAMAIMAAVDMVVQPTLQEAFSQVMAEALWMRKPLVMTDVSGAPDVIQDGVNGFLVPKQDPRALGEAIERLAGDGELRRRLGEAGRAYVEEHLRVERIVPQYERAFERAMEA